MKFKLKETILNMVAVAMTVTMLPACSGSSSPLGEEPGEAVVPNAMLIKGMAYAAPEGRDGLGTPLETYYDDFGVVAIKHMGDGTSYQVIRHTATELIPLGDVYETRFTNPGWTYELVSQGRQQYLRYWDTTADHYLFAAYSPYSVGGVAVSGVTHPITIDHEGRLSIPNIEGNVAPENTIDWLAAKYERYNANQIADYDLLAPSQTPVNRPAVLTATVPLIFHHLLSRINVRAYSPEGKEYNISDCQITFVTYDPEEDHYLPTSIYTTGDYFDGNWQNTGNQTTTLFDLHDLGVKVTGNSRETSSLIASRVEIPQDVSNLYVCVTLVSDVATQTAYFPLKQGWAGDKEYNYYLVLGDENIILMDVDVEMYNWRDGNDITLPDPVTNW